jgi:hypothetical protein
MWDIIKQRIFTMKRLLQIGLIAALLAFTGLAIPTTNTSIAHAAAVTPNTDTTHCASLGTLLSPTIPLTDQGVTLGYLKIYYNSSNGYNCAEAVSSSTTYGKVKYMLVGLNVCTETSPANTCNIISYNPPYYDVDDGNFSYYAGPAGVYGAGHCITAYAEINWNGYSSLYSPGTAVHCG